MSVKISSRLPGGERDGLQAAESDLRDLQEPIVVVAVIYPHKVADVLDRPEDPSEVTCRVSAIEALSGDEAMAVHTYLTSVYERRTGKVALPFGYVAAPDDETPPAD